MKAILAGQPASAQVAGARVTVYGSAVHITARAAFAKRGWALAHHRKEAGYHVAGGRQARGR